MLFMRFIKARSVCGQHHEETVFPLNLSVSQCNQRNAMDLTSRRVQLHLYILVAELWLTAMERYRELLQALSIWGPPISNANFGIKILMHVKRVSQTASNESEGIAAVVTWDERSLLSKMFLHWALQFLGPVLVFKHR